MAQITTRKKVQSLIETTFSRSERESERGLAYIELRIGIHKLSSFMLLRISSRRSTSCRNITTTFTASCIGTEVW